jgi:hypothetical protein
MRFNRSIGASPFVKAEQDGQDGILVTFSDGTNAGYVVKELIKLRPVREKVTLRPSALGPVALHNLEKPGVAPWNSAAHPSASATICSNSFGHTNECSTSDRMPAGSLA